MLGYVRWFVADEVYSRTLFVLHSFWQQAHQALARHYHYRAQAPFQEFSVFNKFFATQPVYPYLQPTKHLFYCQP